MRGLEQGLNDAKLATNVHKMRKHDGEREESDREALQLYIHQALLKEKAIAGMTNKKTPQQIEKAMKDKPETAAKEDTALEEAEMVPASDEDWLHLSVNTCLVSSGVAATTQCATRSKKSDPVGKHDNSLTFT